MRHRRGGSKLKRDVGARNSLLKGLVTSVIEQERVITTVPKAKAIKPLVDRMITLAKRDTLHTRRQAAAFLETPASVKKLFDTLGTRFGQRSGGYTRIVRLGFRKGRWRRTGHDRAGGFRACEACRGTGQAPRRAPQSPARRTRTGRRARRRIVAWF